MSGILLLIVFSLNFFFSFSIRNKTLLNDHQVIPYPDTRSTNNSHPISFDPYNVDNISKESSTVFSQSIVYGSNLIQETDSNHNFTGKSTVSVVKTKRAIMILGIPVIQILIGNIIVPMTVGIGSAVIANYFIPTSSEKKVCIFDMYIHMIENELPKLEGRHYVVILNLANEFYKRLESVTYSSFDCANTVFGIWVFKCGTFWNKGKLTSSDWEYGRYDHECQKLKNGAQIFFDWDNCFN